MPTLSIGSLKNEELSCSLWAYCERRVRDRENAIQISIAKSLSEHFRTLAERNVTLSLYEYKDWRIMFLIFLKLGECSYLRIEVKYRVTVPRL